MGLGTQSDSSMFRVGERLRECREWRGYTREKLVDIIEGLQDNNGKTRSEKQIGYIECGNRALSTEYAYLLAQALNVRVEYLLLKDDFRTEDDRIRFIAKKQYEESDAVTSLIALHGYTVTLEPGMQGSSCHLQYPPGISDADILERARSATPDAIICITAPNGSKRYMEESEFRGIVKSIDDYVEMQMAFLFRKRCDGAKEYW